MFGLAYHRPDDWPSLDEALAGAWRRAGATVIELAVNETDGAQTLQQLLAQVAPANYRARIERLFLFHLQAFDWNCPQHITPRYSAQQVAEYSQNLQQRIHDLEQENQRLQQQLARKGE